MRSFVAGVVQRLNYGHGFGVAAFGILPFAVFAPKGLVVLFILSLAIVIHCALRRRDILLVRRWPIAWIFGLFFAWSLLSVLWSIAPATSLQAWIRIVPLTAGLVLFIAFARHLQESEYRVFERALVWGVCLGAFLLAIEALGGLTIQGFFRGWFGGDTQIRLEMLNRAICVLVLVLWPTVVVLWRQGRWKMAVAVVAAGLLLIFLGRSQSAQIAVSISLVVFAFVFFLRRWAGRILAVASMLAILAAPVIVLDQPWSDKLQAILPATESSVLQRLYIWDFVADRIVEKPLAGWGLAVSRTVPKGSEESPAGGETLPLHPHSAPLQLWFELGLPGASLFALLFALAFLAVGRIRSDRVVQAAVGANIVVALSLVSMTYGIWQKWWLVALGLVAAFSTAAATSGSAGCAPRIVKDAPDC